MDLDNKVFSAMQTGKPLESYRKTILGKVCVDVLSPFTGKPEALILSGDPKRDEAAEVDLWSEMSVAFFKNSNKKLLSKGLLIKIVKEEKEEPRTIEQYSDEELKEVVNQRYYNLQKTLSEITAPAVVFRMLDLAREMDKSEKIIKSLETRLSQLQGL
jgi:hypothetical protein